MKTPATIADAAEAALKQIGRSADLEDIFEHIVKHDLYSFNTPTPEHVLYTTLQRHLEGGIRVDASDEIRFRIDQSKKYSLINRVETIMQPAKTRGPRRIMRSSDKEDLIQELMSDRIGIFREIWRLLLFAAQVGIKNSCRVPLQGVEAGKGIDQSTFGNSSSWPGILYLMSLAEEGGSEVLSGSSEADDKRIILFQEYANGGLGLLRDFFKERAIDLDGVLAFIEANQSAIGADIGPADLDLTI